MSGDLLSNIDDVKNHDIDTSLIDNLIGAQILLRKSAERISALRSEIYRLEKENYKLKKNPPKEVVVKSVDEIPAANITIRRVELSSRPRNALRNAGFKTLGQIYNISKKQLLRLDNFGKKSLKEVESVMHDHGFTNW